MLWKKGIAFTVLLTLILMSCGEKKKEDGKEAPKEQLTNSNETEDTEKDEEKDSNSNTNKSKDDDKDAEDTKDAKDNETATPADTTAPTVAITSNVRLISSSFADPAFESCLQKVIQKAQFPPPGESRYAEHVLKFSV